MSLEHYRIDGSGRPRVADGGFEAGMSCIVAQVYSGSVGSEDRDYIASFILVDALDPVTALSGSAWFGSAPEGLVDEAALVEIAGANLPAVVMIRSARELGAFAAEAADSMYDVPFGAIDAEGWDIFSRLEAARLNGIEPSELPSFDVGALSAHLMAARAADDADRIPGLESAAELLDRLLSRERSGSATAAGEERAERLLTSMHNALAGERALSDRWSVVVPVKVQRRFMEGTYPAWRDSEVISVVVGFGLEPAEAAALWFEVDRDASRFVRTELHGVTNKVRDVIQPAVVRRDRHLDWTLVDGGRRRLPSAYEAARVSIRTGLAATASGVASRTAATKAR